MANSLIPQFPDDPKSRMMRSPSCQGGHVDIRTFWELTAIGEESGAGKITGFFRVIQEQWTEEDEKKSQDDVEVKKDTVLESKTEATLASTSKPSGSEGQYTSMINFLLGLNFSTLEHAQTSTAQWQHQVQSWREKSLMADQIRFSAGRKTTEDSSAKTETETEPAEVEENKEKEEEGKDAKEPLTGTTTSTLTKEAMELCQERLWIQVKTIEVGLPVLVVNDIQASTGPLSAVISTPVVHTLAAGLIKRKSPPMDSTTPATVQVVNTLGAGLIRRKTTTTATTTTPPTTVPIANAAAAATTTAATAFGTAPVVNVLGASFIKKRKIDP